MMFNFEKLNFDLTKKEKEDLGNWLTEHSKTCEQYNYTPQQAMRCLGGINPYRIILEICSFATGVKVRCDCGEEKDISDVDSW